MHPVELDHPAVFHGGVGHEEQSHHAVPGIEHQVNAAAIRRGAVLDQADLPHQFGRQADVKTRQGRIDIPGFAIGGALQQQVAIMPIVVCHVALDRLPLRPGLPRQGGHHHRQQHARRQRQAGPTHAPGRTGAGQLLQVLDQADRHRQFRGAFELPLELIRRLGRRDEFRRRLPGLQERRIAIGRIRSQQAFELRKVHGHYLLLRLAAVVP